MVGRAILTIPALRDHIKRDVEIINRIILEFFLKGELFKIIGNTAKF
jgi:hypothetical protein